MTPKEAIDGKADLSGSMSGGKDPTWRKPDVIAIHQRHGIAPNPLYLQGEGSGRLPAAPVWNLPFPGDAA